MGLELHPVRRQTPSAFVNLPSVYSRPVMKYLSAPHLARLMVTCKDFLRIAFQGYSWQRFCERDFKWTDRKFNFQYPDVRELTFHADYCQLVHLNARWFPTSLGDIKATVSHLLALPNDHLVIATGQQVHYVKQDEMTTYFWHEADISCLVSLSSGSFATGSQDGVIILWSELGQSRRIIKGEHTRGVICLFATPKVLVSIDELGIEVCRDVYGKSILKSHVGHVTCMTQLDDGHLAIGYRDGTVNVASIGSLRAQTIKCNQPLTHLVAMPGTSFATASSHSKFVRFWRSGAAPGAIAVEGFVRFLTTTDDGDLMIGDSSGCLTLVEPVYWGHSYEMRFRKFAVVRHPAPVTAATMLQDRRIVTGMDVSGLSSGVASTVNIWARRSIPRHSPLAFRNIVRRLLKLPDEQPPTIPALESL